MSSDEGSNGNKRKAEEDKKRNANKRKQTQTNVYAPSTASETRQNEQAQEDKNWIKHIVIGHEDYPNCKCGKELPIKINPKPFVMHYKETHPGLKTRKTMKWIFTHFDFVKHKQHLKCSECDDIVEVPFQGQLVDHILTHHIKAAKQDGESSQRSHEDAETTAKLLQFLYIQESFNVPIRMQRKLRECQDQTRWKTWFIKHWDIDIGNYKKKKIICMLCKNRSFSMFLDTLPYKRHIISCLNLNEEEAQSLNNNKKWLTEYFLFRADIMWCTNCNKSLTLHIKGDGLIQHLKDEHNKDEEGEGPLPYCSCNNRLLSRFINHLIDKREDFERKQGS